MRLFPTTPFIPAETPASFASRLAIVNSVMLSSFCRDFQLGQVELTRGTTQSLERLSELTGVDPGMLMQATWRAEHPFAYFRGHAFGTKDRDAEGSRACIQCLLDDHAADPSGACICFRGEWRISCLHICEVHNAPIVTLPKTARQLRWDFVARVLAQRNGLIVPSLRRAPSGLETYVRSRVNGVSQEPNWLDALPVRAAVASCNAIGATAVFGGEHNRDLLTDAHWWEAGGKGFEIISGGADAIAAFLRDHQVPTHGSLHLWLCSAKASETVYDPFRDILTHHFVDTVAFHRNARMFGEPLPAREIHSVVTAAEEFGIFPKFIRRIVLARLPEAEVEQEKADGELTFKAADFADEFRRLASALLVRDLPNYAGCKPMTAQTLVRKGFITPILAPNGDRLGILRFAREDVDGSWDDCLLAPRSCKKHLRARFPLQSRQRMFHAPSTCDQPHSE